MMICRNISVPDGLTNGTRVQILKISPRFYDFIFIKLRLFLNFVSFFSKPY